MNKYCELNCRPRFRSCGTRKLHRVRQVVLGQFLETCHESWIFPAGVSFALKQNMYWDGFCAFLPDISGLWGGGGPNPARISKFGGGGGGRGYEGTFGSMCRAPFVLKKSFIFLISLIL